MTKPTAGALVCALFLLQVQAAPPRLDQQKQKGHPQDQLSELLNLYEHEALMGQHHQRHHSDVEQEELMNFQHYKHDEGVLRSLTFWQQIQNYLSLQQRQQEKERSKLITAITTNGGVKQAPSSMIIDGEESERCSWPWMVALTTMEGLFVCGGTLVDRQYVLTAAHCVYQYFDEIELWAQLGVHNLTEDTPLQSVQVINITVHASYNPEQHGYYDIALLKLAEPAATDKYPECIQTIPPATPNISSSPVPQKPSQKPSDNIPTKCVIIGWGRTDPDDGAISDVLTQKPIEIITNARCTAAWDLSIFSSAQIYPENVCVRSQQLLGSTSCQGDSGGPLQCYYEKTGWVQEGVASWGSAACKYYPSIYTRVARFYAWIQAERLATSI